MIHLHVHGEYSLLDGSGTAKQKALRARELGQPALAQTDHGTLAGALHHIKACTDRKIGANIMPIVGVEAYWKPTRHERENRSPWHQILIAKNLTGWHNLLRLTSIAWDDNQLGRGGGFYQKPCCDWELLERYSEGLIATSTCIQGHACWLLRKGDYEGARDYLKKMLDIFGSDFYIEIQPHDFDDQRDVNIGLVRLAHELGIQILCTCDVHYPYADWADTYEVKKLLATSSSFQKREDKVKAKNQDRAEDAFTKRIDTLFIMSEGEVREHFVKYHPNLSSDVVTDAIQGTHDLTSTITPFIIDKSEKLPRFTKNVDETRKVLKAWVEEGFQSIIDRYPESHWEKHSKQKYRERIEFEWGVLDKKGFLDYFLTIGDVVRWAKSTDPLPGEKGQKRPIRVGAGRGSAAGCLISYLIGITSVDPIPYDLLFERFLNPARQGLPDIDIDFDSKRRNEVKEYIGRKIGEEKVADIVAHATFTPKKVIEDVGRTFDIEYGIIRKVNDSFDIRPDDDETTLEQIRAINETVDWFAKEYPEPWKHMNRMEGEVAQKGKHASAVVVLDKAVTERIPLERPSKGEDELKATGDIKLITAWSSRVDMPIIEEYGFLKADFLSTDGLTTHDYALALIERRHGKRINLDELPIRHDPYAVDPKVMDAFHKRRTIGVWQFAGGSFTNLLEHIQPDSMLDLGAANALHRPGAMKVAFSYGDKKKNPFLVTYWHELVKPFLAETYGIVAYQEQVMRVSQALGNFTPFQADNLRKAMGKLYRLPGDQARRFMQGFYEQWSKGCAENGISDSVRDDIWAKILEFSGYGFNKSHAICYAVQSYEDMWLKVNYPLEFYAAYLTNEDDEAKRMSAIREAREMGVNVTPPDVNESQEGFTVVDDKLLWGFTRVKKIGDKAAAKIVENRSENGVFKSVEDFRERKAGNKTTIEVLEASGGFDRFGVREGWDDADRATNEKQLLGMALTGADSVKRNAELLRSRILTSAEVNDLPNKHKVGKSKHLASAIIGGEVVFTKVTKVKKEGNLKGRAMAFIEIEFEDNKYNLTCFPDDWDKYKEVFESGNAVIVEGLKDERGGQASIVVSQVMDVEILAKQLKEMETNGIG